MGKKEKWDNIQDAGKIVLSIAALIVLPEAKVAIAIGQIAISFFNRVIKNTSLLKDNRSVYKKIEADGKKAFENAIKRTKETLF